MAMKLDDVLTPEKKAELTKLWNETPPAVEDKDEDEEGQETPEPVAVLGREIPVMGSSAESLLMSSGPTLPKAFAVSSECDLPVVLDGESSPQWSNTTSADIKDTIQQFGDGKIYPPGSELEPPLFPPLLTIEKFSSSDAPMGVNPDGTPQPAAVLPPSLQPITHVVDGQPMSGPAPEVPVGIDPDGVPWPANDQGEYVVAADPAMDPPVVVVAEPPSAPELPLAPNGQCKWIWNNELQAWVSGPSNESEVDISVPPLHSVDNDWDDDDDDWDYDDGVDDDDDDDEEDEDLDDIDDAGKADFDGGRVARDAKMDRDLGKIQARIEEVLRKAEEIFEKQANPAITVVSVDPAQQSYPSYFCSCSDCRRKRIERERADPMLKFFSLPGVLPNVNVSLAFVCKMLKDAAQELCSRLDPGSERTEALRKLLECRSAAIRAHVYPGS